MTPSPDCLRCGTELNADGLCPRCLLEAAREPSDVHPRYKAPSIEELAPCFDKLEIQELAGIGGMGSVFRAVQTSLGRNVALKILHPAVATEEGFAGRFSREARTLAALQHSNIVTIYDYGQAGPWFYFVMEFVNGVDLRQMMRAREVEPRQALALVSQLCDALQYAHDEGVVHRDIKPENILVDRRGQVRILDFGLAKIIGIEAENLTRTNQVMGTPHYMAPEQWERPLSVDHRVDIFSLGVVFYELLTGELPVGRFSPPSQRVDVDVRLDQVVLRSLEREPDRRYQHASQIREEVEQIDSARPEPVTQRAFPFRLAPRPEGASHERPKGSNAPLIVVVSLVVLLYLGMLLTLLL